MRACVIFNPVAKGGKARHFRESLDAFAAGCVLKKTAAAGDARRLAAGAVREGFELVIAAGGDGTLNEVLNGLGDTPDGFARTCLGVLPLGTVNVFARELKIPLRLEAAWDVIRRGREMRVDLPWAESAVNGTTVRSYFAQMGGAGLDARAIELVSWSLKKKIGPLAYAVAGLRAAIGKLPPITASDGTTSAAGELVLIGNGRLYGGDYEIFPGANLTDGLLDVCVFPQARALTLLRCTPHLLVRGKIPAGVSRRFRAATFTLTCDSPAAFELDGELIGPLPAKFSVARGALRVLVP